MKVFTHKKFTGHYPVGCAAVVVAETTLQAKYLLEAEIIKAGLVPQAINESDFNEIDPSKPSATVLLDGNY
jgi:hypothetical protein